MHKSRVEQRYARALRRSVIVTWSIHLYLEWFSILGVRSNKTNNEALTELQDDWEYERLTMVSPEASWPQRWLNWTTISNMHSYFPHFQSRHNTCLRGKIKTLLNVIAATAEHHETKTKFCYRPVINILWLSITKLQTNKVGDQKLNTTHLDPPINNQSMSSHQSKTSLPK